MHCVVRLLSKTVRYFFIAKKMLSAMISNGSIAVAYNKVLRSLKNICGQQCWCERAAQKIFKPNIYLQQRPSYAIA